jgi:hypothetical protein
MAIVTLSVAAVALIVEVATLPEAAACTALK